MVRSSLPVQALFGFCCILAAVNVLQAASKVDCRKYPFYHTCRGVSAKRSATPELDLQAQKLLYDDSMTTERRDVMTNLLQYVRDHNLYDTLMASSVPSHMSRRQRPPAYDEDEDVAKDEDRIEPFRR